MKALMILKALADESRLEIFKLLLDRDAYIEVISERLKLSPSTVSFHVKKLCDAGLVTSRREQYYTMYSAVPTIAELRIKDMILGLASTLHEQDKIEFAYKEKVLKSFFKYGRLVKIPVQKKKRQWVMERIANNFLPNKKYSIAAATKLLSETYDDTGLLLKELQSCGFLELDNGFIKRK
jgi:DNA-binding transcriptional ArsR family regulator